MEQIDKAIESFQRLRQHRYRITIENGTVLEFQFVPEQFHHLAGFHHLTDLPQIAAPKQGKRRFYAELRKGKITTETIQNSVRFPMIAERIASFPEIEEILSAGNAKIIVAFDPTKVFTKINAEFFLYKRSGTLGTDLCYYTLFLGCDHQTQKYFPETYLVEHSSMYFQNQTILNCKIEQI
jgi:hypothetical protein